ncbi:type IV toxin-antitoxin system AbiEi family antitoxin domain-containing protein, partial [Rhizobium ruizarguesonis]
DGLQAGTLRELPGPSDWPLVASTPERALLEMLGELPGHESFHLVDMMVQSLNTLSPRRLQTLLADCRNVKFKRLFFFFADRHAPPWLRQIN